MVHRRSQSSDGSGTQRDDQADMVPVCQMVSFVTRNGWHAFDDASWTEAADMDGPNIDDFYQWQCRRMRRILLFLMLDPLRMLIGTCRRRRN